MEPQLSLISSSLHYRVIDMIILSYQIEKQPRISKGGAEKSYLVPWASYSTGTMLDELISIMIQGKDTQHDMVLTLGSKVRPSHVATPLLDT